MSIFRRKAPQVAPAPRHVATHAEIMARIEETRRLARLEDQKRFNVQGLPRFAVPPTEG